MKHSLFVLIFLFNLNLFSQVVDNNTSCLEFKIGILGGTNFNSISAIGGSLQIEVKTNLLEQLFLKASVGYSGIFEDKQYLLKTYNSIHINDFNRYQLRTYSIHQIEYSVIPINLGLEYILTNNSAFSPFALFEIGYSFYSSEEQIEKSTSGAVFENRNDIPIEYQNRGTQTLEDGSFGLSAGVGLLFKLPSSFNLNIRYLYRYHSSLIDVNQILLGITF